MTNQDSNLDALKKNPACLKLYTARMQLRHDGREFIGLCPFTPEKTPSFKVYYDADGTMLFKCFSCSLSGNIFQFIQRFDGCTFPAAVKKVEEFISNSFASTKDAEQVFKTVARQKKEFITIPMEKYSPLEKALAESAEAREWLQKRGITYETARRFHLGFRKDIGKIAGEVNASVAGCGWISIPFIGNNVGSIKYRSIVQKSFTRQPGMATHLFNLETVDALEPVFLTEGEFDTIVLEQAGFRAVSLPSASTTVTAEMKEALLEADTVFLAGDTDPVGVQKMNKLWAEMQERTYLLKWPTGMKDANQTFLEVCGGDVEKFRELVLELMVQAKSEPLPNVYSLSESMSSSTRVPLSEHPDRARFPWPSVDKMAILLPGSVTTISATSTKMGKTQFVMNWTLEEAKRGQVILNYQCELSIEEFSNIAAAYALKKNRNTLTQADYAVAGKILQNIQYYVGRDSTLTKVNPVLDLIENAIRRLGPHIVVLDHLHFICRNESDTVKAQENAFQRIKNMAIKYGVKFVVVGQPRKANQQTRGKTIQISDMKGSETFGSDADAVFAIHRNTAKVVDPLNPPKDAYEPQTEIHLLGARSKGNGNSFTILYFDGSICTFYELTTAKPPEEKQLFGSVV